MAFTSAIQLCLLTATAFSGTASAAFGYTTEGDNFVVDAGSENSLVFSVSRTSCDINSINYRGNELQASGQGTHIGSGLGEATVTASELGNAIKITCEAGSLIHYLMVREGDSSIHMATHITAQPEIGELRYIARLNSEILPLEYPFGEASSTGGSTDTVEGSDVFVVNGETRSKFYSSERYIDRDVHCVHGTTPEEIHVCMLIPQTETSSGGPFFRDIETNNGGDYTTLYNYMNSGHVQTEAFRMGLHGPYTMSFTRSGIPSLRDVDYEWVADLELQGFVGGAGRGTVTGTASGVSNDFQTVVHWHNEEAQYWAYANAEGAFASPAMKPGTYTQVLYQTEYWAAEAEVTVEAGGATTQDIESTLTPNDSPLFRIGQFDGQPFGFRNADKFLRMHPSDARMDEWPTQFTVGTSEESDFPMAIFQSVNNDVAITFDLESDPGETTLRISTTLSFAGARPSVSANGFNGPVPDSPGDLNSRGVTRGAYRGWGDQYDVVIPAGTLTAGENTITISAASGSSGDAFLSPNFVVDAIELF